ncbi:hypothetical protein EPUS_06208 [Endocarpon pusillum Z07020]|uniref:Mediator of RNA polymerase II transcription subunit 16 n=1 Tax=Endocarpon pusillum (strain Z07020 / HMAS-L-300199) TaxID=1263415 RepID=U1GS28_ENDPU|nr:uncharacterized protein EPUS_06208 [Endocarpon pusillum Z07020]ERF75168.1 hypothetical protein EPUS_06208 [Endocarpon pusillum Z07020]
MNGEHVEVDDLFGDGGTLGDTVTLNLPLQSLPVDGLAQYVDDLHRASTEQRRLAWSRLGCLASLAPDARSVNLAHLHFSGSEPKWMLSKERTIDLSANGDDQHPILQLEWSQSGIDLTLVDAAGRVTVINIISVALNETAVVRPATLDREDELNQALAIYWLNVDRPYPTFIHASKDQGKWKYMAAKRRPMGPFWPRGFVVVTRRGTLLFHYQRPDGRWAVSNAGLRSLTSTGYLLSHAAVAPTQDNKLLVAAQNTHRQLLVYVATIDLPDPRQDPQMNTGPTISIENIRASVPYTILNDSNAQHNDSMLFDASSQFLSHLEIVPTSDIQKAPQLPPTIMAFYTPVVTPMGMANDGQLGMTTVRRWHVVSAEHKLHSGFDAMQSKTNDTTLSRRTDLQRIEDVHINQTISTVQKVDGGEHLALGGADGPLALHDPNSLTPLYMANDSAEVTSMAQTGFVFPPYSRGLNLAASPNACIVASLSNDGKMQVTHVEHPSGLTYDSTDSTTVEAAIAAIILSSARSFYSQVSLNDIMLLVTQHLDPIHYPQLIHSMFKDLFGDKDFIPGPEPENNKKPVVARVLSLVASLGHNPSTDQRSEASMLSWLSLNVRSCALTFMGILQSVRQTGGLEWKDPEVCELACNNIRWTLDLCKFIVDDLFEMADDNISLHNSEKQPHPSADSQTITKLLLVSIWPRSSLKSIARILRGIVRATQDPKTTLAPEAAAAFSRMAELIEASPLKMEPLEQLLIGVEKMVHQFYQSRGMTDRDKAETERFILSHGQIPEVLQDVMPRILQDVLPTTRTKMDRLNLYMEDYSWLGIREDKKTKVFKRDFVVDVHRKRILRRKGLNRFRKCVRCGSVSADLVRMRHWPQSLQTLVLRCVCEDVFAVVGLEDT